MPAPCGYCGGTVMSYRRYFLHSRPTAICEACGRSVRLRHFWKAAALGAAGFAVTVGSLLLVDSAAAWGGIVLVLAAGFLALDRWSWLTWPWDPVELEGGEAGSGE